MRQTDLDVKLTCPGCGTVTVETMPTDRCVFFYDCPSCKAVLKPKAGDCCVFCSYGDRRCPSMQVDASDPGTELPPCC